ncbi:MAG TPA: hypothetical protein DDW52_10335 [Planctomycetaceae bacterium]|nr:hypothetical protein [Planctomycetaceae bacterium]
MNQIRIFAQSMFLCLMATSSITGRLAAKHPVSVTKTSVYVARESIDVGIEVFLEDLLLFHDLKPNDQDFLELDIIRSGIAEHEQFLLEKFLLRDVAGETLQGRIVDVEEADLPSEGVALGKLMAHTLIFRLSYELPSAPEFLTFSQSFTDAEGLIPSEMALTVKQASGGEAYITTLKPDEPETIRFNWDNPPLSAEATEAERESWLKKQEEQALGITSYSSVYSFLYIEGFEVRHEILIPLLTLEESVLIARDDDEFLDIAEQDAARQQIEAYFKTGNPIAIDGVEASPIVERCDFYGLDFSDFAQRSERKPVSLASARVGIILTYSLTNVPQSVALTWNRFNNYVWTINMAVFAFEDVSKVTLSRLNAGNRFVWENPGQPEIAPIETVAAVSRTAPALSVPVVGLACLVLAVVAGLANVLSALSTRNGIISILLLLVAAGISWPFFRVDTPHPFRRPPPLPSAESDAIFGALLENMYGAFKFNGEEEIYDALAKSIDGELLEDIYLQIRRGLEMQEQGGAVSRIKSVEIVEGGTTSAEDSGGGATSADDALQFGYQSRWDVAGTVEHWGHIHSRTNQYEARFEIETRGSTWKITDMELLAEERVSFETSLRGL